MVINEKFFVGFVFCMSLYSFISFLIELLRNFILYKEPNFSLKENFAKKIYYNQLGSFFNSLAVIGVSFPLEFWWFN